MNITTDQPTPPVHRIGCVSFLNSKPLIDPLVGNPAVDIRFAVPSALLPLVETAAVSTALLSIVDYQASARDLLLVPAGMIGCDGPTLTVRIFSQIPPHQMTTLHADTDSHTSLILAQLILREIYGRPVTMLPYTAPPAAAQNRKSKIENRKSPESLLLIGDKVVNAAPDPALYPHQLDLGEQWKQLTGLPFVFAMWMMRRDALNRDLARLLALARQQGAALTEHLLDRYCTEKRWPRELARRYFTQYLKYEVTPRARQGLQEFYRRAANAGLITLHRDPLYLD